MKKKFVSLLVFMSFIVIINILLQFFNDEVSSTPSEPLIIGTWVLDKEPDSFIQFSSEKRCILNDNHTKNSPKNWSFILPNTILIEEAGDDKLIPVGTLFERLIIVKFMTDSMIIDNSSQRKISSRIRKYIRKK